MISEIKTPKTKFVGPIAAYTQPVIISLRRPALKDAECVSTLYLQIYSKREPDASHQEDHPINNPEPKALVSNTRQQMNLDHP